MPRKPSPKKLEELDRNFRVQAGQRKFQWRDAFDRDFALRGLAWPKENKKGKNFRRLPNRSEKGLSDGVRFLSHCPAGVFVSFFTDSPALAVRIKRSGTDQMDHMPATGMAGAELYFRSALSWHPAGVARPVAGEEIYECTMIEGLSKAVRECRIYLPLYQRLEKFEVGLVPGSNVAPAPVGKDVRPIFFYGTSITQGGCANTAGSDFVSTVGRLLDAEVINFGFSGNGKGEPEVARLIRSLKVEMFVLDFLTNADVTKLESTLRQFVDLIREKQPTTPIALLSGPAFDKLLWHAETVDFVERRRDIAMQIYLERRSRGDTNFHFIDGNGLLPAGLSGAYVDGVHPTSHGFAIMAERLAPQLRAIRSRYGKV